ncbi:MAG TPA: hypothetical protein VFC07_06260 [Verrucomicrobiae bacterium]|nr:hypothetical protein [Verrucomicrobiae bacterium]
MINKSEHHEESPHHHTVPIKINGVEHKTHRGENTVEHLRKLGNIHEKDILTQEKEGQSLDLEEKGHVEIHGGEVFASHKKHHHPHHEVAIQINKTEHKTNAGENLIEHLKRLGGVPKDEVLSEFKNDNFIDFGNEGRVEIRGGEVFVSHHPGAPIVEVTDLNTNTSVKFFARWEETLAQVWTNAYGELKEARKPGDEFLCEGGGTLTEHLNSTLAQLREQKVCQNRHYQIRRATGGA